MAVVCTKFYLPEPKIYLPRAGGQCLMQTAQGKRKMAKKIPCQGKHRDFGNFAKTQGIWFAQVVNSLILKVKDISKICSKNLPKTFDAS